MYPTIDGDRFMAAIRELVSPEIVEQYFSVDTIQKLLRVVLQRKCAYPERYALVCLVAGISAETLFGPELSREDTLREQTVRLAASGRILKKSEVAAMLGIPCAMLDTAMKRYGIEPFWNWAKVKKENAVRYENIRYKISPEDFSKMKEAMRIRGYSKMGPFMRDLALKAVYEIVEGADEPDDGKEEV